MRVTSLGFGTDVALRVLEGAEVADRGDPADVAIGVYRACGFADTQSQFSFERPSLSACSP